MSSLRVALVQMACATEPERNLERAEAFILDAADRGALFVCLPELFLTQYFCQIEDVAAFDFAEPIPGPTTERLARIANERSIWLLVPLFERRAAGVFHNSCVVIDPKGSIVSHYRKNHIPDDPCYREKFYFTPGDLGYPTARVADVSVGPLICWDQWFPEAARLMTLRGANLLVYPTAIGWLPEEREEEGEDQANAWQTVQRGHAISNGLFVAAINRVGTDGEITFWGRSFLCDPLGVVIAQAGEEEEVLIADCDLDRVEYVRRIWPFLRDRRIDAYDGLDQRFLDRT
ncbi:N-carbamoyl-D-amino acid hydrolase [Planctomycetes bacterium Pan216]|uniref:N-carbamoyl-D-amino acid hydrolase n=1 Tax=Kolteria novifilia TaxID=2527975 RepID=A0A518B142_9BACT|nr:N-carbamoyl-D-amino acid hydrolase [Planctomycetes bacterium Pan216]